jgi:hypothetical protein
VRDILDNRSRQSFEQALVTHSCDRIQSSQVESPTTIHAVTHNQRSFAPTYTLFADLSLLRELDCGRLAARIFDVLRVHMTRSNNPTTIETTAQPK